MYVPQDPSLFAGDLRSNLDPFGQYTDEQIHDALREVGLIDDANDAETIPDTASSTPASQDTFKDLGMVLSESGSGVSLGQRQLLCLARALLRNPKIVIMDEATASIDYATDKNIQLSISRIKGTVITIAHRLRTIIDYDNVLVMEQGRVEAFGHPWELLQQGGRFRDMCMHSGDLEGLEGLARAAWEKKRG